MRATEKCRVTNNATRPNEATFSSKHRSRTRPAPQRAEPWPGESLPAACAAGMPSPNDAVVKVGATAASVSRGSVARMAGSYGASILSSSSNPARGA